MKLFLYLFLLQIIYVALGVPLEQVDDTDLMHLITEEENVVALFTISNCKDCAEWEAVVENVQNELKDTLGAVIVKAHNSNLVGIYNPTREPCLIYFRRGIPLLYHGERKEDEIVHLFSDNRSPIVKELSDENFEHLTQAATGATTGDWFVFFYSADCVLCQRLYAIWETVGAKIKLYANVARVNRLGLGLATAKRFGVTTSPEFIFLRHGKVYRYKSKEYTAKSFIDFVETGYRKQTDPEAVPAPSALLDDLVMKYLEVLISNRQVVIICGGVIAVITSIALLITCFSKKDSKSSQRKKASKKVK